MTSETNLLPRMVMWGVIGGAVRRSAKAAVLTGIIGPLAERPFGFTLEDVSAACQRQAEEQERQRRLQRLAEVARSFESRAATLAGP